MDDVADADTPEKVVPEAVKKQEDAADADLRQFLWGSAENDKEETENPTDGNKF